jgi:type IX secretion system PorP/SprF family membrane protein
MKKVSILFCLFLVTGLALAQDPHFSQYQAAPMSTNPSLAGHFDGDLRAVITHRRQWFDPANPYQTSLFSTDIKLGSRKKQLLNYWSLGGSLMADYTFNDILNTNYVNVNLSYHLLLNAGVSRSELGLGIGLSYGESILDYSRLTFDEQFDYDGFNPALPTGEPGEYRKSSAYSVNAGLVYALKSDKWMLDLGIAGFNLNTPVLSVMNTQEQQLPLRWVAHSQLSFSLSRQTELILNGNFQRQAKATSSIFGAVWGFNFSGKANTADQSLKFGVYNRWKEAIIPYLGYEIGRLGFGISYDFTNSALQNERSSPRSYELSLIFKTKKD